MKFPTFNKENDNICDPNLFSRDEIKSLKLDDFYKSDYNTIDFHTKGDKLILITDHQNLKLFSNQISKKIQLATTSFSIFLLFQFFIHFYMSYSNLIECENRINHHKQYMHSYDIDRHSKEISYICATYLMNVFLLIGYFVIAIFTISKQTSILFQVFEIYIIIMFIADIFFSFVNPYEYLLIIIGKTFIMFLRMCLCFQFSSI